MNPQLLDNDRGTRFSFRTLTKCDPAKDSEFFFEPRQIRKRNDHSTPRTSDGQCDEPPNKKVKSSGIPCLCDLTIWDNRDKSHQREIVIRTQKCLVTARTDTAATVVDIEMDRPFVIKATELYVPVGESRTTRMKMAIGTSYFLQTSIFPVDNNDPWPPIPLKKEQSPGDSIFQLLSKWVALPQLPEDGNLLPIEILDKPLNGDLGKISNTKYCLQVNAGWVQARSALEQMNDANISSALNDPIASLLTPVSKPEFGSRRSSTQRHSSNNYHVSVKYVFTAGGVEGKSWNIEDRFRCPLCRRDLQDWRSLRFHLSQWHDNFVFEVEGSDERASGRKTVKVGIVDGYVEKASDKDSRELSWQAPKGPCDIEAHMNKQEVWAVDTATTKKPKDGPRRAFKQSQPVRPTSSSSRPKPLGTPGESNVVEPNPRLPRKRHPVPRHAANVTFFRSRSKRPLNVGEQLDESDHEIDTTWLKEKHLEGLSDLQGLAPAELETMKATDTLMLDQKVTSKYHLSKVLAQTEPLMGETATPWKDERKKGIGTLFTTLSKDGLIDDEILRRISKLSCRTNLVLKSFEAIDIDEDKGKPKTLPDPERRDGGYTTCKACAKNIELKPDTIICSNVTCESLFHIRCVGLEERHRYWTCSACNEGPTH